MPTWVWVVIIIFGWLGIIFLFGRFMEAGKGGEKD